MAEKKITELQLAAAVVAGMSLPADDGLQTYRVTATQIKNFVLANQNILLAMLKDDIFSGLTGVTPALDDYIVLADTSDSNKNKKGLVSDLRKAGVRAVSSTDTATNADEVLFLSGSSFTQTLPTAVSNTGKIFEIFHAGTSLTQAYTITSAVNVGGSASIVLYTAGESVRLVSNGATWEILDHRVSSVVTSFTPTNPTNATSQGGRWWREGRNMCIRTAWNWTGAGNLAPGTASIIPSNAQAIDTAALVAYTTNRYHCGHALAVDTGTNGYAGSVFYDSSVPNFNIYSNPGWTPGNGDLISVDVKLPLTGWIP